jgi:hypothetical protein
VQLYHSLNIICSIQLDKFSIFGEYTNIIPLLK